jgi:ribonucleoside-diphosphate reductase alpha chain
MEEIKVKKRNGRLVNVDMGKIQARIKKASTGLKVNHLEVSMKVVQGLHDGVTTTELDKLAADTAASLTTNHPDYSKLAANIAISALHKETFGSFEKVFNILEEEKLLNQEYKDTVKSYGFENIEKAINYEKDFMLDYFGFKTLEKAYLLRIHKQNGEQLLERPQDMYMREAITVTKNWEDALETYKSLSNWEYTHATPTMFNSGLKGQQLASCFLINNKGDSKDGIMDTAKDVSIISSFAGGIGLSISNLRAAGSIIHSTNGTSNGILPYLRTFNELARYWDQCFDGNQEVETDEGFVKFKDLTLEHKVITSDGNFYPLHEIMVSDYEGEIIEINGVKVTPKHPFYIIKGGNKFTEKELQDRLDSKIVLPEWIEARYIGLDDLIITV